MKDNREKRLFCITDEIWPDTSKSSSGWLYISSVFIDQEHFEEVVDAILNARYMTGDWKNSTSSTWKNVNENNKWFPKNNEIVKFSEIEGSANKREIAKRWLNALREETVLEHMKIKVMGVNTNRLSYSKFGKKGDDRENRIYSRLYRAQLLGGTRYFYGKEEVKKEIKIYHDERPRNQKDFERILSAFDAKDVIVRDIEYMDDNHRQTDIHSKSIANLIQFTDLIAGCTSKAFNRESLGPDRKELVQLFSGLVEDSRGYKERENRLMDISSFPEEEPPETGYFGENPKPISDGIYKRELKRSPMKERAEEKITTFL